MATKYGKITSEELQKGRRASGPRRTNRAARTRATRARVKNQKIVQIEGKATNLQRRALKKQASNLHTIDGIALNHFAAPSRSTLLKADSILMDQGYTETRQLNGNTNKKLALDLLKDLNCTVVDLPVSYSLVTSQTDTVIIDNPYIEDPNLKETHNNLIAAKDSFPEECDPFYQLDEAKPRNEEARDRKGALANSVDLTVTAATLANMNFIKKQSLVLNQFVDRDAKRRSKY